MNSLIHLCYNEKFTTEKTPRFCSVSRSTPNLILTFWRSVFFLFRSVMRPKVAMYVMCTSIYKYNGCVHVRVSRFCMWVCMAGMTASATRCLPIRFYWMQIWFGNGIMPGSQNVERFARVHCILFWFSVRALIGASWFFNVVTPHTHNID